MMFVPLKESKTVTAGGAFELKHNDATVIFSIPEDGTIVGFYQKADGSCELMYRDDAAYYALGHLSTKFPHVKIDVDNSPGMISEIVTIINEERNVLEAAWAIIANVSGGDWDKETPEWKEAARTWRDKYHDVLRKI